MLTGTSHLPLASVPSVACDNHAQLVSKVLHLMNLSKGSRMVDLIQAFHHVRLIAEDMEHKGTLAGRSAVCYSAVCDAWLRLRAGGRQSTSTGHYCQVTTSCCLLLQGQWSSHRLSSVALGGSTFLTQPPKEDPHRTSPLLLPTLKSKISYVI